MSDQAQPGEGEVTMGQLDGALQALLQAADATDMNKALGGVAIDQGGHVDERGQTGGGYVEQGDIGALDSMMVGKMQEALVDAGFPADAIAAFMKKGNGFPPKKGGDEGDGDDDADDAGMNGKMGRPASTAGGVGTNPRVRPSAGGMGKSETESDADYFAKSLADFTGGSAEIADAVDVSPFMREFTEGAAKQFGALAKSIHDSSAQQAQVNRMTAVAIAQMGGLLKSLHARVVGVEDQPRAPRGATSLPAARAMHKSIAGEAGAPAGEQLTKSELISTLSYMNLEKSIKDVNGISTSELVGLAEAGGQVHPIGVVAAQRFLATHPHEAATARRYR